MSGLRTAIGVAFLLFQLVMIVYARFVPSRYFCWAPYDAQSEYSLQVTIDGRPLTNQEIRRRYRRPQTGVDNRSIQHVIDIVQQYEETRGRDDHARVIMKYKVNGGAEEQWQWPPE
ncbi:MAG: hypothetical protein HY238_23985 [Acidobacteria bacterium]|nr:hypothetical protein [Acidobacteriota bacterium]